MHQRGKLNDGEELKYAFGLGVGERKGLRAVEHSGALGGYRSMLVRFPDERFSVVVLANVSSAQPGALAAQVAELYLADRFTDSLDVAAVTTAAAVPESVEVPAKELERLTGHYWNTAASYSRRIYVRHDGSLMYWRSFGSESTLAPLGDDRFRMLDVGARVDVAFEVQDGKSTRMVVTVDDGDPIISEAYEPAKTPSYVAAFEGTYHSPELLADYELFARGGALIGRGPDGDETPLLPGPVDLFTVSGAVMRFTRGEQKQVDGFVLDAGRVKGLRFDRR